MKNLFGPNEGIKIPTETTIRLSQKNYVEVCVEILKTVGVPREKGEHLVKNLMRADMRGISSHGVNHFFMYVDLLEKGVINPKAEPEIVRETPSIALINGHKGFGQLACKEAAELAAKKAKENVVGSVGVFNCGHVGHISDYTRMILEKGMIGIMYLNCDPSVAAYGGKKSILGTNPISFAIPAGEEDPIIIDFATSVTAGGYITDKLRKGEKMPEGWAIDSSGNPTTDPKDVIIATAEETLKIIGAQLPAAGHKGYGLALAVDVLAGALTGGKCDGDVALGENFAFIQAIDPGGFVPREEYEKRVDKLIRTCRASPTRPGVEKVLIPGDPERKAEKEALELGIPVAQEVWEELSELGQKHGINVKEIVRD